MAGTTLKAMKQIDLDDVPPRVAQVLASLQDGEELLLVQGGAVVGRLAAAENITPPHPDVTDGLPAEERMGEVMSQFNAMIHDEF
jgi:antitoxin (DNA-binding transcriptional repressor) of toxin-antitoxin stability system